MGPWVMNEGGRSCTTAAERAAQFYGLWEIEAWMLPMMNRSAVVLTLAGIILCLAAGCGDGRIDTYPVTGKVVVDGRPAEGAMVVLYPVEGKPEFMKERPFGKTDAQGVFFLTTFIKGDGAPAGDYKVMVSWERPNPRAPTGGVGRDVFGGRYFNPQLTPLTCTIVDAATELPPFELSTRQPRS